MSRLTGRVGGAAARHPWRTIAAWLILIVALFGLKMAFGGQLQDDYTVPGTSSQAGADFLRAHFPQMSGTNARVVIHDRGGPPRRPGRARHGARRPEPPARRLGGRPAAAVARAATPR